jgi:hypothetical protein
LAPSAARPNVAAALALALALAGRSPRSSTGPLGSGGRRSNRPQGWPQGCGQGFRQARDGLSENPDRLSGTLRARMREGRGRGVAFLWPTFLWPHKERWVGQPKGLTESSCSWLQTTERRDKTGASVELMVGQGPPYDSREVGQTAGLTESSCSSLRATE